MFTLKPEGDITITITITIVQKPLKTFARKSEKEEDFFWKKNCWFEKKDKKSRLRIAVPLFRQRSCCIYLLPFLPFTIYYLKRKKIEAGLKRVKRRFFNFLQFTI